MTTENLPPEVGNTSQPNAAQLVEIATGQRMLIGSILVNLIGFAIRRAFPISMLNLVIYFAAVVLAVLGVLRLAKGLDFSKTARILILVAVFIPFANLITLAVLNHRATKLLRNGGYRVGLFGATKT